MNRFLDRCREIGFVKYVASIVVAVVVTLMIVDATIQDANVDGCERRKIVQAELAGFLWDASQARLKAGDKDVADLYLGRRTRVLKNTPKDCEKAYPPLIPFVE